MGPDLRTLPMLLCGLVATAALGADSELLTLRNNPFSRPEVVTRPPPPPPPPAPVVVQPEEVRLNLTATLVSETTPMVIVDGKLLGIGDSIEELMLISVMEGSAIFVRGDKKYSFTTDKNQGQDQ